MCGIAGSVNYPLTEKNIFSQLLHRGPDEQGSFHHENISFYHSRLSILDISSGKQPMHLNNRYTIVFNGEIFNHQELRTEHGLKGTTNSDTETLLLLYKKLGKDFLHLLDGMFVFAIYDKDTNKIFIARDRAGMKPLYYFYNNNRFVFASELNALREILPLEIDHKNFYQYLRFGTFYKRNTPYKNVKELYAGTYLEIDCNTVEIAETKWWDVHQFYLNKSKDSFEESLSKVDSILHQSVKRRLESSELEVGAFLSGGIDSGLVTSVARQYNPDLKTFTISFGGAYDESHLARLVAEKYHTNHHEIRISFDNLLNDVETILSNYGEPFFDSSAIPSFYVSKAAKEYVSVILNGDGADELFGGYRRYVPFAQYDFFKSNALIRGLSGVTKSILPASHEKKSLYNYFYRLLSFASLKGADIYLSAGVDIFEGYTRHFAQADHDYMDEYLKDFDRINQSGLSGIDKIMNLDFEINLFNDMLVKMDIATMANSQEGRSPFMCKEFLEYIPTLPGSYKVRGKQTKALLRTLAEKYLPSELIHQPKRGFEIPLKKWVNGELKSIIAEYVSSSNPLFENFLEKDFVRKLLDNQIKVPAEKRAKMLWTLFSMEVWYRKVYEATHKKIL
ncbi:MAG: asparagine synthase (glutamine-hydrolyzing) [Chitinophagaceae bacterium]|nr:asparagine synthase (glutamine-hydrolyzing) [Chitinophagaceae bacterium]